MKNLKAGFVAGLLACSMGTAALAPPARAAVGISIAQPWLVVIGTIELAVGIGAIRMSRSPRAGDPALLASAGILNIMVGVILLDDETGGAQYGAMSASRAQALGVTDAERVAYNHELPTINAAAEEVSAELAKHEGPTPADSTRLWREYREELSPGARGALSKIAKRLVDKAGGGK